MYHPDNLNSLLVPFNGPMHIVEVQRWLKEYDIKHGPTVRRDDGWLVTLIEDPDQTASMALKLMSR